MDKRHILVLAPYTNGYEAAQSFIRKNGWKRADCEIIFCGSHKKLLERLCQAPAMAVVPVYNSERGDVQEVTQKLSKLATLGFKLVEVGRLTMPIRHCLLAQPGIMNASEINGVLSHSQALGQCSRYLDNLGIPTKNRSTRPSTGDAARELAKDPKKKLTHWGAIASEKAAKAYGLKVLAKDIQNSDDNCTTFLLLNNDCHVSPKTVGIVGIEGKMAKQLKVFFKGLGCAVIGSDPKIPTTSKQYRSNKQVIDQAEVVIFASTLRQTPQIIRSIIGHGRKEQLFLDIASVKVPAVTAMLEGKGQVVGLHPMFGPDVPFAGQTIVVCPARLTDDMWKQWLQNVLVRTRARIKWTTAQNHDKYMEPVQIGPQSSNFVNAMLNMVSGIDISESLAFTSPFYRVMFSLMGRMLSQDPDLYAAILMENPRVPAMLAKRETVERNLRRIVERKDYAGFKKLFRKVAAHFGTENLDQGNELFKRLLPVLNTFYGPNTLVIEYPKDADRPGLLDDVLKAFRRHKVNLRGIQNSAGTSGRNQFIIGCEQSKDSESVRHALEDLEHRFGSRIIIQGLT